MTSLYLLVLPFLLLPLLVQRDEEFRRLEVPTNKRHAQAHDRD